MYNPIPLQFISDYLDSIRHDGIISSTFYLSKHKFKIDKESTEAKNQYDKENGHLTINSILFLYRFKVNRILKCVTRFLVFAQFGKLYDQFFK